MFSTRPSIRRDNQDTPPGHDILTASASNLYPKRPPCATSTASTSASTSTPAWSSGRRDCREVYRVGGRLRRSARPHRLASRSGHPVRPERMVRGAEGADRPSIAPAVSRSARLRTSLGRGPGFAGRYINGFIEVYMDPRRPQGGLGSHRLLHQPREDRARSPIAETRRGSKTTCRGSEVSQAEGHRRHGAGDRRGSGVGRSGPLTAIGINRADDQEVREPRSSRCRCRTCCRPTIARRRPACARSFAVAERPAVRALGDLRQRLATTCTK